MASAAISEPSSESNIAFDDVVAVEVVCTLRRIRRY